MNQETAYLEYSAGGRRTYSKPAAVSQAGDRANPPAVAIAPDGSRVWLTYNAYSQPWQSATGRPRPEAGVVRTAAITGGEPGTFTTVHQGTAGDARASAANSLTSEFAVTTTTSRPPHPARPRWNDVRDAADCPAIDTYRQSLATVLRPPRPRRPSSVPPRSATETSAAAPTPAPKPSQCLAPARLVGREGARPRTATTRKGPGRAVPG